MLRGPYKVSRVCTVKGCGKPKFRRPNGYIKSRYCSMHRSRLEKTRWDKLGSAKATRASVGSGCVRNHGYKVIVVKGKQWLEHRLVWTKIYGPIPTNHDIHHKNGVKTDNRLENLICLPESLHMSFHRRKK